MEDIIEKAREAFKLSAAEIGTPRIELGFAAYKADVLPLNYVPSLRLTFAIHQNIATIFSHRSDKSEPTDRHL